MTLTCSSHGKAKKLICRWGAISVWSQFHKALLQRSGAGSMVHIKVYALLDLPPKALCTSQRQHTQATFRALCTLPHKALLHRPKAA